jgi:myo-inositol-hexaphosphate 3-phosphohydrolase
VSAPVEIDMTVANNGLIADVEGVSIRRSNYGRGWIVASEQASDRYVA